MRCPPHQPQGPAVGQASGQSFFVGGGGVDTFGSSYRDHGLVSERGWRRHRHIMRC